MGKGKLGETIIFWGGIFQTCHIKIDCLKQTNMERRRFVYKFPQTWGEEKEEEEEEEEKKSEQKQYLFRSKSEKPKKKNQNKSNTFSVEHGKAKQRFMAVRNST